MGTLIVLISQIEIGSNFPRPELEVEMWGGVFISAESRRQTGKWKIIPIERLIIIIIIIPYSFQDVCSTRPFHRDMNGSNELSHILFQLPFLPLQDLHPRPLLLLLTPSSYFRQGTPNRILQPIVRWHTSGNQGAHMWKELCRSFASGNSTTGWFLDCCSCISINPLSQLRCNFLFVSSSNEKVKICHGTSGLLLISGGRLVFSTRLDILRKNCLSWSYQLQDILEYSGKFG